MNLGLILFAIYRGAKKSLHKASLLGEIQGRKGREMIICLRPLKW